MIDLQCLGCGKFSDLKPASNLNWPSFCTPYDSAHFYVTLAPEVMNAQETLPVFDVSVSESKLGPVDFFRMAWLHKLAKHQTSSRVAKDHLKSIYLLSFRAGLLVWSDAHDSAAGP